MPRRLGFRVEKWPISGAFTISRGAKTEAAVIVAEISDGTHAGLGECVPYARYGESLESVGRQIEQLAAGIADGMDRETLQTVLPAGAARNALDCALWDLEAKRAGAAVASLAGIATPAPVTTAYTLSLDTPENMAAAAKRSARPVLKLKFGADRDAERLRAVREAAPGAKLIVDANEGWSQANLEENLRACAEMNVALVEQPLSAGEDEILREIERLVPLCADECFHDRESFAKIEGKYDAVNIKLDKTGGLTEALLAADEAQARGLQIMIGCMVATSLSMAPALLLANRAAFVDLDGPLLLAKDREHGLRYEGSTVFPPEPALWG
ncbi:MAG: dipeptide epimerase [Xanthobacteraceae bacterium]|nr:dipeptide epimerase [Xanthobacteraceae bacterium]